VNVSCKTAAPMLTPAQLSSQLAAAGYSVTTRALSDWVRKGLLPSMQHVGRGRGRGKTYGWAEREIFDQALTVYEQLAEKSRVDPALFALWMSGYTVQSSKARQVWLARIDGSSSAIETEAAQRGGLDHLITHVAGKIADQRSLPATERNESTREALTSILDVFYEFDAFMDNTSTEGALYQLVEALNVEVGPNLTISADCSELLAAFVGLLSHQRARNLVQTASDKHLDDARVLLAQLRLAITELITISSAARGVDKPLAVSVLRVAGPPIALFYLAVLKGGQGQAVDGTVRLLRRTVSEIVELWNLGESRPAALKRRLNQLATIWRDVDVRTILKAINEA
jgi:hypothetical protein